MIPSCPRKEEVTSQEGYKPRSSFLSTPLILQRIKMEVYDYGSVWTKEILKTYV